jgi:hypothetical protein
MHHIGTITKSSKFPTLPFHAQCSCGTAGDFSAKESAEAYLQSHFGKQGGLSTTELLDKSDEPEVVAALPLPHAPSAPVVEEPLAPVEGEEVVETADPSAPVPEPETTWKKKKK